MRVAFEERVHLQRRRARERVGERAGDFVEGRYAPQQRMESSRRRGSFHGRGQERGREALATGVIREGGQNRVALDFLLSFVQEKARERDATTG